MKSLSLPSAMVLIGAAVALTTSGFASEPTTWYVDDAKYGASGTGESLADAFGTIQEAIDAAVAGDTVLVAEGTYNRGAKKATTYTDNTSSRVVIDKAITVKSISGRGRTFIVGEGDYVNEPTYGLGPNAVRCVAITAQNAVLEGFTLTGGRVYDDGSKTYTACGGGICMQAANSTGIQLVNAYIVDCSILNCIAPLGGGASGGSLVRCLVTGNRAYRMVGSNGVQGQAARYVSCYNCVFTDNGEPGSTGSQIVSYIADVVNCTFVGNSAYSDIASTISGGNGYIRNTIVMLNPGGGRINSGVTSSNCIGPNPSDKYILVSPIKGDWRPISGKAADGKGDVESLQLIPEAYRDKDFLGNSRKTDGTVCIGAVESTVTPASGSITFTARGGTLDGCLIYAPNLYHYAVEWPVQVHLEPDEPVTGKAFFGWVTTESGLDNSYALFPERSGGRWVTMPPSGTTLTCTETYGTLLWVDAASTAGTPDGLTTITAYPTIQEAVDKTISGESYRVIRVKKGEYKTGSTLDDSWGASRVYIRYKNVLLWSESGPEETFIVGDAATGAEETYGVGDGAVRCLCFRSQDHMCASGFTLTEGHTQIGSSGSDMKGQGGAVRGYNSSGSSGYWRHQIVDCVISNNVAYRAPAGAYVWMQRCLVTGNRDQSHQNAIFREGDVSSCVFRDNIAAGFPAVGQNVNAWGCTFRGVAERNNIYHNGACLAVNCLFIGGNNPAGSGSETTAGNFADTDGTCETTGFTYGSAQVARAKKNDFRPRVGSPLVGGGDTSIAGWARFAVSDFDGNPMTFTGGKPTIGAYQVATDETFGSLIIVF